MNRTPDFDDAPPPSPWEAAVDRLRNMVDGLEVDELLVLTWLVRSRLLWVTRHEEILVDTSKLSGRVLEQAELFNDAVRRRVGGRVSRRSDSLLRARADTAFQRLLKTAANPSERC